MSSDLRPAVITSRLQGRFGRPLRWFDSIPSTNAHALEWAMAGAPEGALVVAEHQTAGRGRLGRRWLDRPGGMLMLSLVLRPELPPEREGLLPTAAGLACAEAIESLTVLRPALKWPNDVTLRGRKVAGILVETRRGGPLLESAVVGIGINVAWRQEDMPAQLRATAVSLSSELAAAGVDAAPDRGDLLAALLLALERVCSLLPSDPQEVVRRAAARSIVLGRTVVAHLPGGGEISGRALRLHASGGLELATEAGPVTLHSGEITRLRPRP